MRTLLALGALAIVTGVSGRAFGLRSPLFVGSELALLVTIFLISRLVLPLVDRRDRGAAGEEQVGRLLDGLGAAGWSIIHDASLGHGNIDHIVLGAAGVFTVETKSHPGPVRVQRIHGATFRQAREQATMVERLTGERVEPLIVYSRAWVDRPLVRRRGVRVLPARMLIGYLDRRSPTLTPEQVELARQRIAAALANGRPRRGRLPAWPAQSLRRR